MFGLLKPPQQGPPLGKAQAPMAAHCQSAFAEFLDASWSAFRKQMLQAYEDSQPAAHLTPDSIGRKIRSLEQELQELRSAHYEEPDPVLNGDAHHPGLASEEPVLRIKDTSHAELLCNMKPQRLAIDDEQARLVSLDPEFQESLVKGSSENISLAEAKSAQGSMEATDDFEHAKGRVSRISATSGVEDEKGGGVQVAARDQQTNAVRHRLRLRLGAVSGKKLITAKSLHNAIEALGLTTYTEEHCNDLVNQLADYIDLKFVAKDKDAQFARSNSPGSHTGGIFWENERNFGRPVWNWPKEAEFSRSASREIQTNDLPAKANANVVPIQALMDLFLARDSDLHKKIFGPFNRTQFQGVVLMRQAVCNSFGVDTDWALASFDTEFCLVERLQVYGHQFEENNKVFELVHKEVAEGYMESIPGGCSEDDRLIGNSKASGASPAAKFEERAEVLRETPEPRAEDCWVLFSMDVKSARKFLRTAPEVVGFAVFHILNQFFVYLVNHFGTKWSAYWWSRCWVRFSAWDATTNLDAACLSSIRILKHFVSQTSCGWANSKEILNGFADAWAGRCLGGIGGWFHAASGTRRWFHLGLNREDIPEEWMSPQRMQAGIGSTELMAQLALMIAWAKVCSLPCAHRAVLRQYSDNMGVAMKEILLAGDTNRLVAELTFVRINDLAAPPESINPLMYIEPFVSFLIIANGIMIGFQTDRRWENWSGWPYIEGVLAFFLLLESSLRFYLSGPREFACGPDWLWNWFDFFLMLTGVTDVVIQAIGDLDQNMGTSSLLRFCRLIRLVRVVKVFRLKCMKELRLMVKGLVAGLRTLLLAFALLFTVLYVISGFATMTIGRDERTAAMGLDDLFADLPQSMFTAFRCYSGECMSARGEPIQVLLAENFGFVFVFCYVVTYMLVALGIFNVILAVYVDITMRAAKETEAVTSEQHARESIRIARTTRELLKKFAQAYRLYQDSDEPDRQKFKIDSQNTVAYTDEDINDIAFSKELFLLVIQDRNVQALMDDLDLPPDRANLFEVIDADGSGTMDVTELVQGMLKIRGDVKKSDTVATLLATKALQEMVSEMRNTLSELESRMIQNFPASAKVA
ncbi:Voltage-dependent L-type calcium channel subunit alpha-1C [Symbiodinium microadriaticum]|uniref:Voltage-dependent L-type calcium channel subunit alpha-1C n=1 Tax=Symbiodinium microadriaticum TaxID=2951 RepID=A0A1Q9CWP3_SYMMI|nr:Voltage-dependent L-type calcium channel subunit alpha-1C [Symbiodinium microadriaticum]